MNTPGKSYLCPVEVGVLKLQDNFLDASTSDDLFQTLISMDHWNNGQYTVAGRRFSMPRIQSWYADPGVVYNFSYDLHPHRLWTWQLFWLKQQVEAFCRVRFNSVLINLYRNGRDWVDWHSDNEIELGDEPFIASVSLGVSRKFCYRHKKYRQVDFLELHNGSLLIMNPAFQYDWQHCVAREHDITSPRINLTFRYVVMPDK